MSSDINSNSNNNNYLKQEVLVPAEKRKVIVDESAVKKTLKNIASPVFEFFTKVETPQEEVLFKDYEKEIDNYNMKYAVTQRILNDADPNAKKRINIII